MKRKPGTKRRAPLFAKMLRAVADEAKSAQEVAAIVGITNNAAMRLFRQFYALGLVHIGGWTKPRRGSYAVAWRMGAGEDAPRPLSIRYGTEVAIVQQQQHAGPLAGLELVAFATAIRTMEGGATTTQVVASTGWNRCTALRFIKLARAIRLVHVCDWARERHNGDWTPLFQIGDRVDEPKPKPIPRKRIESRSYAGRKQKRRDMQILHALAANTSIFTQAA